ncbi:MAG: SnoaL-like domain-containing protein [Rhabdaerophilum sp.]
MTPKETAEAFTAMLKAGDHEGAATKFNAEDIVSYEAMEGPMAVCKGRDAVKAKSDWWYANHEIHSASAEGPHVNGNQFVVHFQMDITAKETGQRMQMAEVGLYTVKDGKIVEEKFFYPTM